MKPDNSRFYVRYCESCIEKLRGIKITGTNRPRYTLEETPEDPRPGQCPLCGNYAHMLRYEMHRNAAPRYRKQTGGGERQKEGRAG